LCFASHWLAVFGGAFALIDRPLIAGRVQLFIGQTLLVQSGALLVQLRLGALPHRLLLGDPRSALGNLGLLLAAGGLLTVLGSRYPTALLPLSIARPFLGAPARTRQHHPKRHHEQHDNDDDRNDQASGHRFPPLSVHADRVPARGAFKPTPRPAISPARRVSRKSGAGPARVYPDFNNLHRTGRMFDPGLDAAPRGPKPHAARCRRVGLTC
jgi:hypothetical protein